MKNIIQSISFSSFSINFNPPQIDYPSFNLSRNDFPLSILGNNGSGKSSLTLALVGAIPEFIDAQILNYNFNVSSNNVAYNLIEHKNLFRLIPQKLSHGLLGFTPRDEINLIENGDPVIKQNLFESFEIDKLNNIPSPYLSDGEKKRLIICSALIANVPLIISDEWMGHLDKKWIARIAEIFRLYENGGGLHLSFLSKKVNDLANKVIEIGTIFNPNRTPANEQSKILFKFLKDFELLISRYSISTPKFTSSIHYGYTKKKKLMVSSEPGDLICLVGPNGSGKTTILKTLWRKSNKLTWRSCFDQISNEQLLRTTIIMSDPIHQILGPTIRDEIIRNLNIADQIEFLLRFFNSRYNINTNVDVLSLSLGQRKLLAIMQAMFHQNNIILIDEPFSGLDEMNSDFIVKLFEICVKFGKTIIFSDQNDPTIQAKIIRLENEL